MENPPSSIGAHVDTCFISPILLLGHHIKVKLFPMSASMGDYIYGTCTPVMWRHAYNAIQTQNKHLLFFCDVNADVQVKWNIPTRIKFNCNVSWSWSIHQMGVSYTNHITCCIASWLHYSIVLLYSLTTAKPNNAC